MAIKPHPSPPPHHHHKDGQRMWGGSQNCWKGGRLAKKEKYIGGVRENKYS